MKNINGSFNLKEITISITQRGQVTLPVEVMQILGVKPRGKVAFQIDGDSIRLLAPSLTLEALSGSLNTSEELESLLGKAKEEKAKRRVGK